MSQLSETRKTIQILKLIDQLGSIRLTAQKLYITQPAVSRYLIRLERSLGVTLVNRQVHPYHLTVAGQYFVGEEEKSYQHQLAMSQHLKLLANEKLQQLSLGINSTLSATLLPLIFPAFHRQYPGVLLTIVEADNRNLNQRLAAGAIDVHIGISNLQRDNYQSALLYQASLSLVIPRQLIGQDKAQLLTSHPSHNLDQLLDHLPIFRGATNSGLQAQIDDYLLSKRVNPEAVLDNISMQTGIALAKTGSGAIILPDFLVHQAFSDGKDNQLFYFQPIDPATLSYTIKIYWNSWFKNQAVIQSLVKLGRAAFSSSAATKPGQNNIFNQDEKGGV